MKKWIPALCILLVFSGSVNAQIDLNNLDYKDIIGKVMHVKKGFAPSFSIGKTDLKDLSTVADILSLKKSERINKYFNTFRTGRTVYKIASYAGGALAVYAVAKKLGASDSTVNYKGALTSGLVTIGSGLAVKFLTKSAAYKAVDIFNGIAIKKIKDIFSIAPATTTAGLGVFVKF